jgi:hypothetical protein
MQTAGRHGTVEPQQAQDSAKTPITHPLSGQKSNNTPVESSKNGFEPLQKPQNKIGAYSNVQSLLNGCALSAVISRNVPRSQEHQNMRTSDLN